MKGNWGSAILLYVVSCVLYVPYGILNRGGAIAGLAVLLLIFVYLPINFGLLRTFLAFARDKRPLTIEGLFCAFNNTYYWKAIGTGLLSGIYTFLWTLLLIVPGIIKGLSYAMALYIVSDNPEIGCDEAIERSMAMMRGHKMRLFLMQLGMIGWSLLSLLTLGIAMLWIVPYYQLSSRIFTLKSRPNTKRPGMRLKEQPIAPAIGTEKTGPRSNAISRSCFFRSFRRFWQIETSATSSSPSRSNTIALSQANRRHRMPGAKSLRKRHSTSPSRTDRTAGPWRCPLHWTDPLKAEAKTGNKRSHRTDPRFGIGRDLAPDFDTDR